MTLDELTAIEEIRRLKARYFRFLDRKQWDDFKQLFTEQLHVEINEPGGSMSLDHRDDFVAGTSEALAGIVTVHHGHMSEITIEGSDAASGIWAMEDHLRPSPARDGDHYWGKGWYEETYLRGDDGLWRIASLKLVRQTIAVDGRQIYPPPPD
jgi:hypothetical protein